MAVSQVSNGDDAHSRPHLGQGEVQIETDPSRHWIFPKMCDDSVLNLQGLPQANIHFNKKQATQYTQTNLIQKPHLIPNQSTMYIKTQKCQYNKKRFPGLWIAAHIKWNWMSVCACPPAFSSRTTCFHAQSTCTSFWDDGCLSSSNSSWGFYVRLYIRPAFCLNGCLPADTSMVKTFH